jgi:hypothetical protein
VAKSFDSDFYVTCATIIPVLFLAVAVQGRSYGSLLERSLAVAQDVRGDGWRQKLWPYIASRLLKFLAYTIWIAGGLGEGLALTVLYRSSATPDDRMMVYLATLVLVAAVATGPLSSYVDLRRSLDRLGFSPSKPMPPASQTDSQAQDVAGDGRELKPEAPAEQTSA